MNLLRLKQFQFRKLLRQVGYRIKTHLQNVETCFGDAYPTTKKHANFQNTFCQFPKYIAAFIEMPTQRPWITNQEIDVFPARLLVEGEIQCFSHNHGRVWQASRTIFSDIKVYEVFSWPEIFDLFGIYDIFLKLA